MRKEFATPFWQRAYESLPKEVRAQYLTQIQAAERWELATAGVIETLSRACEAYAQPEVWTRIVRTGMSQDWSWARSAKQYVALYQQITSRSRQLAGR